MAICQKLQQNRGSTITIALVQSRVPSGFTTLCRHEAQQRQMGTWKRLVTVSAIVVQMLLAKLHQVGNQVVGKEQLRHVGLDAVA